MCNVFVALGAAPVSSKRGAVEGPSSLGLGRQGIGVLRMTHETARIHLASMGVVATRAAHFAVATGIYAMVRVGEGSAQDPRMAFQALADPSPGR